MKVHNSIIEKFKNAKNIWAHEGSSLIKKNIKNIRAY